VRKQSKVNNSRSLMSTPFIRELLTCMDVLPKPLFQGDVDSTDSHVDNNNNNGSDHNNPDTEGTMPTQVPEASGKNEDLIPSIGLLDRESYVDMRAPWVEGAKGEKVRLSGMEFGSSLILVVVCSPSAGIPPRLTSVYWLPRIEEGGWLGRIVEKACAACAKCGDSCLHVIVNDFGDIDLGACVWCKARSVGCSTAQHRGQGGASKAKAKDAEEPNDKRKASEVKSEDSEEEPLAKKFRLKSIIEDSEEEEWGGIQDKGDWPKESGEVQETKEVRAVTEEVREEVREVWEVTEEVGEEVEEVREMDKREAKRARKEVRRSERKARRSERSEDMKDLIHVVIDLGKKVDWFADEVRVSNALRNRADREYLEERRWWYFSERLEHARDWNEDSERYLV
jgi:hypothetical protein